MNGDGAQTHVGQEDAGRTTLELTSGESQHGSEEDPAVSLTSREQTVVDHREGPGGDGEPSLVSNVRTVAEQRGSDPWGVRRRPTISCTQARAIP